MSIFSEVEGLSGENLSSALLRYLIFNSSEVRDAVFSYLSDESPSGPISYASHFACTTEYPTTDESFESKSGRLDILIQTDNMAIGIENKFFAEFQEGQPQKYLKSLADVSESLSKISHSEVRPVLYVLCPESRKAEAMKKALGFENIAVITWERLIAILNNVGEISDPVSSVVLFQFLIFIKNHLGFIDNFERKVPHILKSWQERGTPLQWELVVKLWYLFNDPGSRLSNGREWIGYSFYGNPDTEEMGWYGFVPSNRLNIDSPNKAELIVVATNEPELSDSFVSTGLKFDNFMYSDRHFNSWVVRFDGSWNTIDKWRIELSPFDIVASD